MPVNSILITRKRYGKKNKSNKNNKKTSKINIKSIKNKTIKLRKGGCGRRRR